MLQDVRVWIGAASAQDLAAEEHAQLMQESGLVQRRARAQRVDIARVAPDVASQIEEALPAGGRMVGQADLPPGELVSRGVAEAQVGAESSGVRADVEVEGSRHRDPPND